MRQIFCDDCKDKVTNTVSGYSGLIAGSQLNLNWVTIKLNNHDLCFECFIKRLRKEDINYTEGIKE